MTPTACGLITAPIPDIYSEAPQVRLALQALRPHQRARVWREERHRYIPAGIYRRMVSVLRPLLPALPPRSANRR
jgi:hypothetical protein